MIFILPLLEQKMSNDWLKVPALNIINKTVLSKSATVTLMTKLNGALSLTDLISFTFFIALFYVMYKRTMTNGLIKILLSLLLLIFLESPLVPYGILEKFPFISMIQSVNRLDVFYVFGVSFFVAETMQQFYQSQKSNIYISIFSVFLLSLAIFSIPWGARQGIVTKNLSDIDKHSYLGTNSNIKRGFKNSHFGYFTSNDYKAYYRFNGFYDYRTKQQIVNKENNIGVKSFPIKNNDSLNPYYNFPKNFVRLSNDFMENTVYFDGIKKFNHFHQTNFIFKISDIPTHTINIQTPITYLKGFKVFDSRGRELKSYKNEDGWLEIKNNQSSALIIKYKKTVYHIMAIAISLATYVVLLFLSLYKKLEKIV